LFRPVRQRLQYHSKIGLYRNRPSAIVRLHPSKSAIILGTDLGAKSEADMGRLTARKVETAKPGVHLDGQGLRLIVGATGGRKWVFRFMRRGRSQEMGLGGANVSLAVARERASDARRRLAAGQNPLDAARLAKVGRPTFGQCADDFLAAKEAEWRSAKHRAQWAMTLRKHAAPLRSRPVDEIDTTAVLEVLQPLWTTVPVTASRLRGRIEMVLDAARARGLIGKDEANPARWRGHLDKLLSKRQKLTRGHHAAMPFADVPQFVARLRERDAMAALALEFTILTAARTGEALGARWDEIDFEQSVWTVPSARMKGGRLHRVALSGRAMAVLKKLNAARTGEYIFPGQRPGKPLSGMVMEKILRRMKADGVTVHGFRSSFRDWCGEVSTFPREVAEAALAHVAGDQTERAYRRGDALEKRRALMEAWAQFCEPKSGNVVSIARRAR
jgi:integrase